MTDSDTNDLVSAAIIVEYDKTKENQIINKLVNGWYSFQAFITQILSSPLPELLSNRQYRKQSKYMEKKGQLLVDTIEKAHRTNGPEEVHWYIALVGVGPEHKGKGYGGELMRKIGDLADEAGVLCYLECGTKNKAFYEKMGYEEYSKHTLEDPVDPRGEAYDMFTMVRKPLPPIRAVAH